MTAFGSATSDGMNEKGLAANLLYLDDSQYEARNDRPALSNTLWAQSVLDNFATVEEALAGLSMVQVVATPIAGREWPLHLSLADAGVYSVARNVAVPFGAEDTSNSVSADAWPTLWFTIADVTNRVCNFQSTRSPNLFRVDLGREALDEGAPIRTTDAYDPSLTGNVSAVLKPAPVAAIQP